GTGRHADDAGDGEAPAPRLGRDGGGRAARGRGAWAHHGLRAGHLAADHVRAPKPPLLHLPPPRHLSMLPAERLERVPSWGGATSAMSWVYRPTTVEGLRDVLALARAEGRNVGLRGAGQSYGDAATNAETLCLDTWRLTRILDWDPGAGRITVEPGVTIRQLWQYALEDGWWPPVVSGTMQTSLGGAASMNIHGKNNFKVGTIGEHVEELDLLLASGEVVHCSRTERPELFHAAIGGFGMLGMVTSLTLRMKRVHSGLLDVEAEPVGSLDELFDVFEARLPNADYLVGWVDTCARGAALGRGLVHQANYVHEGEDRNAAQTLRVVN